jgi:hypothetical protein
MFTCANCGRPKEETERGAVGFVANVGCLIATRSPWWPSAVCKQCVRQVRLFGALVLAFTALVVFGGAIWKLYQ